PGLKTRGYRLSSCSPGSSDPGDHKAGPRSRFLAPAGPGGPIGPDRDASVPLPPDREADEAGDRDVFAELGDRGLDELVDGGLRVADRRLVDEHVLLVEAAEL